MLSHLVLWLLSTSLIGLSEGSFQVILNQSWTIFLQYQEGDLTTGYGFSLQQNTLLAKMNFSVGGELVEPPAFAVLPNVLVEINGTDPILSSTSVRGFLDFTSWSNDWGMTGLLLEQPTPVVYKISGSWYSKTAPSLNFRVRMLIASRPTVYEGVFLRPQEIFMIYTIVNFPFELLNSMLTLDQITLTGTELTNYTLPSYFVFTSGNLTSLYVNKTAIIDGIHRGISLSKIRVSSLWAKVEKTSTTVTRNLSGRDVDDFVLIFSNSNNAKNVTVQQVLRSEVARFARQSTRELLSHAPRVQDPSYVSWILGTCHLILIWHLVFC